MTTREFVRLMEIRKEHVEWAVVRRLSKLLDKKHEEFNVTSTYSYFATILCWVTQRVRADDQSEAQRLFEELEKETVEDWGIHTRAEVPPLSEAAARGVGPFPEFAGRPASKFLVDLRNAVAHGDARTVEPYHLAVKGRATVELAGFTFYCEEKTRRGKVVWKGSITLLESDMRRFGLRLADRYCEALGGYDFAREASSGVFERGGDGTKTVQR